MVHVNWNNNLLEADPKQLKGISSWSKRPNEARSPLYVEQAGWVIR
jgi:hypothetical protein